MRRNIFAVDIETIPNTAMIDRLPEVKPSKTLVDPVKIAKDIAEKKAEQISKMALNPLYGRVCAVVFVGEHITSRLVIEDDTDCAEAELLDQAFEIINKGVCLVSYNGNGFDLPYLYKRNLILRLTKPRIPLSAMINRYDNSYHIDLMQVWTGNRAGEFAKLDDVASGVLNSHKIEIDVTTFPELIKTPEGRAQILEYCEMDVRITYELFRSFDGVLF